MHCGVGYSREYCSRGGLIKLSKQNTQFIFIKGVKLLKERFALKEQKKTTQNKKTEKVTGNKCSQHEELR
jgi:hypothetical protein